MSENDMNEQPPNTPPTGPTPPSGPTNGPAEGEVGGWRQPAEPGPAVPPAATPSPAAMPPATPPPAPAVPPTSSEQPAPTGHGWAAPSSGYQPQAGDGTTTPQTPAPGDSAYPTAQYPAPPYSQGASHSDYPAAAPYAAGAGAGYAIGSATPPPPGGGYPGSGDQTGAYPSGGYPGATHEPKPHRNVGGLITAGALGLVLALGGGVAGAAIMHQFDKNDRVTVNSSGVVVDNAPIIDRSSLASIASAVSPSVVSITTQTAEGSGVVLSADGYVLTNNHVAATASGSSVSITFSGGNSVKATLVGTDPKTDLAVYKAENVAGLTVAKFGNSDALHVGDTVLAIGSPLGLDGSVSAGIVSALNRTIDESSDNSSPQDPFGQSQQQQQPSSPGATIAGAIQTDAAINPGNSGGALVNTNGQVVGINTAIATNGADGNIGVGFAIPSNRAKQVADDLIQGVKVSHPQLGVGVTTADDNAGAQVGTVTAGSPAAKAGLKVGDVITAFNGQPVHTSDDLLNDVQGGTVGKSAALTVTRDGATTTINVTLGEAQ
jgi:putative serine protease PepD